MNGAAVYIVYQRQRYNLLQCFDKSAVTISKLPYARQLANLFSGKWLKLLPQVAQDDVREGERIGRPSEFAPQKKFRSYATVYLLTKTVF